jgi:hypothetical protein
MVRARNSETSRATAASVGAARHRLEAAPIADVEDGAVEPFAVVALDGAAALEHPALIARGGEDAVLELELSSGVDRLPDVALDTGAIVGMDERRVGPAAALDEVVGRVPGDALDLVADEMHGPVRIQRAPIDHARDVSGQRDQERRRVGRRERSRHHAARRHRRVRRSVASPEAFDANESAHGSHPGASAPARSASSRRVHRVDVEAGHHPLSWCLAVCGRAIPAPRLGASRMVTGRTVVMS